MKIDIETKLTGWALILAALMLLLGWVLLPHHIGEYLVIEDFPAVNEHFWTWIWLYRLHIFGWVIMGAGLLGLGSLTFKKPYRALLIPGIGVVVIGTFVSALATAFYYSFGAWGIGQTEGKSPEEIQVFMDGILHVNHYVTCLVRFGRVFSGAGLVIMGVGLLKWKITDRWLAYLTMFLGLAAMGIVMLIPVNYEIYKPIFYVKVLWLIAFGATLLTKGLNIPQES